MRAPASLTSLIVLLPVLLYGSEKKPTSGSLEAYLRRIRPNMSQPVDPRTAGSLWSPGRGLTDLASDNRARWLNDTLVIRITEETFAEATGAVTTKRAYAASSGITALPGRVSPPGINPLYDLHSNEDLQGAGQASSRSRLRSSLAGRIVAVLPEGALVIEASKTVLMNNEKQTVTLRGLARPIDIASDNSLLSTRLSDLEIEVNGKGIISDSTRRPHWLVRLLTRVLSF